ncbi:MAG: hypothetical protein ABL956_06830 [Hyphomonadaceae bacterium]
MFEKLENGLINPEKAEVTAKRRRLGPLNPLPDPADHDPMRSTHWTLAMTVAWISWRDMERVREVSPDWRKQLKAWVHRDLQVPDADGRYGKQSGWRLEPAHKDFPPLLEMSLSEAAEVSEGTTSARLQRMTIRQALSELWDELARGKIEGTTVVGGKPWTIPATEWGLLEPHELGGRDVLIVRSATTSRLMYEELVVLLRRDVLELWPEQETVHQSPQLVRHDIIRAAAEALNLPGPMRAPDRDEAIRNWITEHHKDFRPSPGRTQIHDALKGTKFLKSRSGTRQSMP